MFKMTFWSNKERDFGFTAHKLTHLNVVSYVAHACFTVNELHVKTDNDVC